MPPVSVTAFRIPFLLRSSCFLPLIHHFLFHPLILPQPSPPPRPPPVWCRGEGEGSIAWAHCRALLCLIFFFLRVLFCLTTLSLRNRIQVQPLQHAVCTQTVCFLHADRLALAQNLVYAPSRPASSLALFNRWPYSSLRLSLSIDSSS